MRLRTAESAVDNLNAWLRQIALVLATHAGLAVLISAVIGWPWVSKEPSPVIVRRPVDPFAWQFIIYFAIVPALAATIFSVLAGWPMPVGGFAPLVVLSGLAIVLLAGNGIELSHQHIVIGVWFGLLLVPPLLTVLAVFVMPWVGVDLNVNKPAKQIAQFFSESFQRRTGTPLQVVAGDPRTAALISLGATSRPSLFLDATPERTPWVTFDDVRQKGAVLVWPATDTAGAPPPQLKERFPDIVPDATRVFDRPISGRLPALRYGWAVIRPQSAKPAPAKDDGKK
jgi:hypothetical protein